MLGFILEPDIEPVELRHFILVGDIGIILLDIFELDVGTVVNNSVGDAGVSVLALIH